MFGSRLVMCGCTNSHKISKYKLTCAESSTVPPLSSSIHIHNHPHPGSVTSKFFFSFLFLCLHSHPRPTRICTPTCPHARIRPSKSFFLFFFFILILVHTHRIHPHATHPHVKMSACNTSAHPCLPSVSISEFFFCLFSVVSYFLHTHPPTDPHPHTTHPHTHVHYPTIHIQDLYLVSFLLSFCLSVFSSSLQSSASAHQRVCTQCIHMLTTVKVSTVFFFLYTHSSAPISFFSLCFSLCLSHPQAHATRPRPPSTSTCCVHHPISRFVFYFVFCLY